MAHPDWVGLLTGVTLTAILGQAVNTAPTPKNVWAQWILGIIKFAVGQRLSALNMMQGNDTVSIPVAQGTGSGAQAAVKSSDVVVSGSAITINSKSKTVIPTGGPGE